MDADQLCKKIVGLRVESWDLKRTESDLVVLTNIGHEVIGWGIAGLISRRPDVWIWLRSTANFNKAPTSYFLCKGTSSWQSCSIPNPLQRHHCVIMPLTNANTVPLLLWHKAEGVGLNLAY